MTDRQLFEAARAVMGRAYSPYSGFRVGASLLSISGKCFTGCNVENASYDLTMCAERVAVYTALAAGERRFSKICVISGDGEHTPPCGACRQVLWELSGDLEVLMADPNGEWTTVRLSRLLPDPFGPGRLPPSSEGRG